MKSLAAIVRSHADEIPDKRAIVYEDRDITYRELHERTNRVAQGLLAAGVAPQEHVAFLDKNVPEYFEVLFGGAKVNAINVAVNWRLAPPEMAYMINDAQAKVLFVGSEFLPQLEAFESDLTTVTKIVVLGDHDRHESYEAWVDAQDPSDTGIEPALDDVCIQLYTSGTTGHPKGVMLTNDNLFGVLIDAAREWSFDRDSVNLVVMPLFHIAGSGWAICGLYWGAESVLQREVNPARILEAIPKYGVTNALFVPAVLQFLLITPGCTDTDFSTLRTIVYGASPITEDVLVKSMETFKCGFVQAYGMTETTGAITILRPDDHDPGGPRAKLLRSCGVPFGWVEIRIVDPATGEDKAVGEVGEIWSRSRQNMKGYWNLPDETKRTIAADGWLRTGDAAYSDEDGYIYIYDRVKDMIVSGGENVYPAEVENALMSHPAVADCAVIGVPDDRWGETVKALIVPAPGAEVTEDEIIAHARERIAGYKIPRSVDFIETIPRNPSGKILKRELREPYWAGHERRVH